MVLSKNYLLQTYAGYSDVKSICVLFAFVVIAGPPLVLHE